MRCGEDDCVGPTNIVPLSSCYTRGCAWRHAHANRRSAYDMAATSFLPLGGLDAPAPAPGGLP